MAAAAGYRTFAGQLAAQPGGPGWARWCDVCDNSRFLVALARQAL